MRLPVILATLLIAASSLLSTASAQLSSSAGSAWVNAFVNDAELYTEPCLRVMESMLAQQGIYDTVCASYTSSFPTLQQELAIVHGEAPMGWIRTGTAMTGGWYLNNGDAMLISFNDNIDLIAFAVVPQ